MKLPPGSFCLPCFYKQMIDRTILFSHNGNRGTIMKVLTDLMLREEMHTSGFVIIIFPMIVLILLFVVLLRIYYVKVKEKRSAGIVYHGYGYLVSIAITIILMTILVFSIDDISNARERSDWYVTSSMVSNKRVKINTGDSGQDTFYVTVEDDELIVSQREYDAVAEGEMVYVLWSESGDAQKIYPMDTYTYTGSRLKD